MHAQRYTLAALPALMLMLTTMTADAWGQQTPKWEIVDTATMHYYDPEAYFNRTDLAAAADEHSIVAVGSEWYARKIQHVRRTTDGGASWQDVLVDSSRARWNAMAHPEPSLIVIAGDTSVPVGSGVGSDAEYRYHGRYMISRNGGGTWARAALDSDTRVLCLAMCNPLHGAMAVLNTASPDSADYLLRTDDGWHTSTKVPLPTGYRFTRQIVCPAPDVYILISYNLERQKDELLRTTDGGAHWRSSDKIERVRKMRFTGADTGWSASGEPSGNGDHARDVIVRTIDGGMTWQVMLNKETGGAGASGLTAIDFADANNGIAVGALNKILRTTDGGVNWRQEFPPSELPTLLMLPMRSVLYPKRNLALAFYTGGPIIRYNGVSTLARPTFTGPIGNTPLNVENVHVTWTPVDGATGYHLTVAGTPIAGGAVDTTVYHHPIVDTVMNGTSITLNGLLYAHLYFARVRAFNSGQNSGWHRDEALFYTRNSADEVLPPTIITPVSGATNQPTTVTVAWDSVPGGLSYDLQIGNNGAFIGNLVVQDSMMQATQRTVQGLAPNTDYYVRVRARHGGGITSWSSAFAPHTFRTAAVGAAPEAPRRSNAGLLVSPNPARGVITIDAGEQSGGGMAYLHDALGRPVRSIAFGERATVMLPVADLPQGPYTVVVTAGATRRSARVMVMR